jgi:hypothetical protein
MTKNFYFSYTYDLTNTLQVNMTRPPYTQLHGNSDKAVSNNGYNLMFVWNYYLMKSGFESVSTQSSWILPMIYGFVDQASMCSHNIIKYPFYSEPSLTRQPVRRNISPWQERLCNTNCSPISVFCWCQILEERG